MSDNVINLRSFRKANARTKKENQASANRHKHGRTRAQKDAERLEFERQERELDGARRDNDDG